MYRDWSGIIDGLSESMRLYRDSETVLANYRELQEWLGERGVKSVFRDIPGFILGFMDSKTCHQESGIRNNYFFPMTGFVSHLL